jgi:hypothetical protein
MHTFCFMTNYYPNESHDDSQQDYKNQINFVTLLPKKNPINMCYPNNKNGRHMFIGFFEILQKKYNFFYITN